MEDYRKTVMVVDSRSEERDAVKMMLSEDYKVLEATGAGDAMLQISCKSMVDAILLGNLRQDGREVGFLDKIRNSGYGSIPVLVILEDSEEDPGLEALDHGAWDYVTRPVRPKTPVSYTHLDVYKRQTMNWWTMRTAGPRYGRI